jgi:hypothetical protein
MPKSPDSISNAIREVAQSEMCEHNLVSGLLEIAQETKDAFGKTHNWQEWDTKADDSNAVDGLFAIAWAISDLAKAIRERGY